MLYDLITLVSTHKLPVRFEVLSKNKSLLVNYNDKMQYIGFYALQTNVRNRNFVQHFVRKINNQLINVLEFRYFDGILDFSLQIRHNLKFLAIFSKKKM